MIMDNYNYPIGSDNSNAPWNQEPLKSQSVEVVVSITLSKVLIVDAYEDDNGELDLKGAVMDQVVLPGDSTWSVDDFEVVSNE